MYTDIEEATHILVTEYMQQCKWDSSAHKKNIKIFKKKYQKYDASANIKKEKLTCNKKCYMYYKLKKE